MAENSKIEWTNHTFNPWTGCTKVSPGCDHCYAESWAKRSGLVKWGAGQDRRRTSADYWRQPIKWNRQAEHDGIRRKVFCASLADVFDNQVPDEWRADLWELIASTPHLDWLLLTKRPQNILKMLPAFWSATQLPYWPNVWLGTTCENQQEADRRIPHLLAVPAVVRFLSCEPLLGPVDISAVVRRCALDGKIAPGDPTHPIGWVIAGGESGPGARPWSIQWARSLRGQCEVAGVPFFWKQHGEWAPAGSHRSETPGRFAFGDYEHDPGRMVVTDHYPRMFTQFGARSTMQHVGKKAAGHLLDGVEWRQTPGARP